MSGDCVLEGNTGGTVVGGDSGVKLPVAYTVVEERNASYKHLVKTF